MTVIFFEKHSNIFRPYSGHFYPFLYILYKFLYSLTVKNQKMTKKGSYFDIFYSGR